MKKLISLIIVFVLVLAISMTGCTADKNTDTPAKVEKQFVSITTGGTGGTYYPIGGAIAQAITENLDYVTVNAQAGNASVANCNLIDEGETESALVQNNVAFWAYNGVGSFEGEPLTSINGIASLYPEAVQIVALKESGIKSVEDLAGKRVCVGELGSGVHFDVKNILAAHDMSEDDLKVDYLSFSEAAQKLKDKQLDAAFITAGYPTSSITDVNLAREIVLVPIAEDKIEKMIETSPYYAKAVIPGSTYSGVETDTVTATTMAMWVVSVELSEELVYDLTKTMWENVDTIQAAHEKGQDVTLETALEGMGIPLHPGAEKYYKEVGLIKE